MHNAKIVEQDVSMTELPLPMQQRWMAQHGWCDSRGMPVEHYPIAIVPSATVVVVESLSALVWRVVVHQRTDNQWYGLPGGRCEIGESLLETARRECWEETGLEIADIRLTSIDSDPTHGSIVQYPDGNVVHYVNHTFVCRHASGQLWRSEESLGVFWAPMDTLPEPFMPIHRWRLQQAYDCFHGCGVVVR